MMIKYRGIHFVKQEHIQMQMNTEYVNYVNQEHIQQKDLQNVYHAQQVHIQKIILQIV